MPRFYLPAESFAGERVEITGNDAFHLTTVLRVKPGTLLSGADGEGALYQLRVVALSPDRVECEIIGRDEDRVEPKIRIRLFQSLLKGEKMDWVLQKGTEIGVSSFHPFISQRTIVRKKPADFHRKNERWSRIVLEAAKQSGRGRAPEVFPVVALEELATVLTSQLILVPWEEETLVSLYGSLSQRAKPDTVDLVIGPEGGFSVAEAEYLMAQGGIAVSLGPRILRAETAGPMTTALILYHYREMEPV